jgi:uncharacterized membrane protein
VIAVTVSGAKLFSGSTTIFPQFVTKVIDLTGFFNNILGGKTFGAAWATAFVLLHLSSVSEIFSTLLPANEGSGAKRNAAITVAVTTRFILTPTQLCQAVC